MRSKSAYHSPTNRNQSASIQKHIDMSDSNGIYTKFQNQSLQARQQRAQSGSIASQASRNSQNSTANASVKLLKTAPPIVPISSGMSSNSSMTSLVTKDASTVILSSASVISTSSQLPNSYNHGGTGNYCIPLKKQVANDLEHEFGIPLATKKPQSAGFLPLSIPTQRTYSNVSGSNPATPIFKSTSSTSDLSLHSARGGGITSTSTATSSSTLNAFFSHSTDNSDPYLTVDTRYIGIGNSMRTYGDQAMVAGIRATSASRGILSAKSQQTSGMRKAQHVDFSYS